MLDASTVLEGYTQLQIQTADLLVKVIDERDAAYDLLGEYFDIHRHDPQVRELQRRTEALLYGPREKQP